MPEYDEQFAHYDDASDEAIRERVAHLHEYHRLSVRQQHELDYLNALMAQRQHEWQMATLQRAATSTRNSAFFGETAANPGYGDPGPRFDRALPGGEYSRLHSATFDGSVDAARRTVDKLHSRSDISDFGADALWRMLDAERPDDRWRNAECVKVLGSPEYERAFIEGMQAKMNGMPVSARTQDMLAQGKSRAMQVGVGSAGGFAVPFQLDPTLQLTSSGAIDPVRQIARVELGTAKEFDLVTSAGVTAQFVAEGTEAGTGDPLLVQPSIIPRRMQVFVPFSIELDVSWARIRSDLTYALQDAGDVLDAQSHITGSGTAPNVQGIVIGLQGGPNSFTTAATANIALADWQGVQRTVPPRFRSKGSQWITNLANIQRAQAVELVTGESIVQGSHQSTANVSDHGNGSLTLLGDPLFEASFMDSSLATGTVAAVCGDFYDGYCIYDVIPSLVELVPHLFGTARNFPTGQRGLYHLRYTGSKVVNQSALATLVMK